MDLGLYGSAIGSARDCGMSKIFISLARRPAWNTLFGRVGWLVVEDSPRACKLEEFISATPTALSPHPKAIFNLGAIINYLPQ